MADSRRQSPFPVAPEEEQLYGIRADGSRRWIDPRVTKGRYRRVRRIVGYSLMLLFVALPHVPVAGKPSVFLDLASRQFTFFGVTLHPTDNLLLVAFGAAVILTIFFLTAMLGRVWCGYACPQTVYMEFLFRPIEQLVEGRPAVRRRRDAGPRTAGRIARKTLKVAIYVALCLFLSLTFVSYFLGWSGVFPGILLEPAAHDATLGVLAVVAGMMLIDFLYMRDQVCTVACPYGRLQTVLYDDDTVIVGYDEARGEPRGKRRKSDEGKTALGDCVDCRRCVTTCPTGMDIRRGLQMECIGCAQCVEACDEVMAQTGRDPGLVRYTSLRELGGGKRRWWRPRVAIYLALMAVVYTTFWVFFFSRHDAEVEFLRGGREAFRPLPTGQIANQLRVRFTNHRAEDQAFSLELLEPADGELVVSVSPFVVGSDAVETLNVVVKLPRGAFRDGRATGRFRVRSDKGFDRVEDFRFLGPHGGE